MDVLAVVQNDSTYLEVSQHLLTAWACRVRVESLGSYPLLGLLGGVGLHFFYSICALQYHSIGGYRC